MKKHLRKWSLLCLACLSLAGLNSCDNEQVIIYTNADEEARDAFQAALDESGYAGQYILTSFSTSELGGKLMAEGSNIEADILTQASYYLESAQNAHNMFKPLDFERDTIREWPVFFAPTSVQEGAIFVNTKVLESSGLEAPQSFKDLAHPKYKGMLSIPNIMSSSTAWLMVQAILSEYGEEEGARIMSALMENAGSHIENSGSGPLKKLRAGEVAVAFGLRQQAVADKKAGLPIDYIDPAEGNFSLTEGITVVNKGDKTHPLAAEMVEAIIKKGRKNLIQHYPVAIYKGETADAETKSAHPRSYSEPLTIDLLKKHQEFVSRLEK